MPFTDIELAHQIPISLVEAGVLTPAQVAQLAESHTEEQVRGTVAAIDLRSFPRYWLLLNRWMAARGGSIKTTTGRDVPGRTPGADPGTMQGRVLYDDAFKQTRDNITKEKFSAAKAVASALRFSHHFLTPEDEED